MLQPPRHPWKQRGPGSANTHRGERCAFWHLGAPSTKGADRSPSDDEAGELQVGASGPCLPVLAVGELVYHLHVIFTEVVKGGQARSQQSVISTT